MKPPSFPGPGQQTRVSKSNHRMRQGRLPSGSFPNLGKAPKPATRKETLTRQARPHSEGGPR